MNVALLYMQDQPDGPRRLATSSPGQNSRTSLLRQQVQSKSPPVSHGNRPTRSVTFAEPLGGSLQAMPGEFTSLLHGP